VIGGRGPDGYQWPIPDLLPFSGRRQWTWSGQWELNAWPNFAITIALMLWALRLAWRRGHSPVELFSSGADEAMVRALRERFGQPPA
jgi:inner membrane protein